MLMKKNKLGKQVLEEFERIFDAAILVFGDLFFGSEVR